MKKSHRPTTKVKNPEPKDNSPDWVIWAAWADRITFEEIKKKTGKSESEVIRIMRNSLKPSSFKWIGIIYISYLAYDIYISKPKNINSNEILEKSFISFFKDGFIVAGTSPKAWMFFPFIFPQFIDFNSNYIVQFLILITTYVVLDFLSLVAYAVLAKKLIVWLKANPKTINTISACVLITIAIIIAITQQY